MQCHVVIDERVFPSYASTIMTVVTTPQVSLIYSCVFHACNTELSLGDKKCIKDSGDEQGKINCTGICALRSLKAQHLCSAHLGIRECRTLLPWRQRKGLCASQHITAELPISHFMSWSVRGKSACINSHSPRKNCFLDSWLQYGTERMAKSFCYSYFSTFPFFPFSFSAVFLWCVFCSGKQAVHVCMCVCVCSGPLQQPHLLVDIVAILQPALSSSRWWS